MRQFLKKVYQLCKNIPVIGPLCRWLRVWYGPKRFPSIQQEDLDQARVTFESLFEVDTSQYLSDLRRAPIFSMSFDIARASNLDVLTLYLITRHLKPEVVVETGVASGRSSAFILQALTDNNKGKLYSIDLPQYYVGEPKKYINVEGDTEFIGFVPKGEQPGWLIPKYLKNRWHLLLGTSKEQLPKLLEEVKEVDMFYHDSDHSYDNMLFEFKEVWPRLRTNAVLLSDDTDFNNAFNNFVAGNGEEPKNHGFIGASLGIVRKG